MNIEQLTVDGEVWDVEDIAPDGTMRLRNHESGQRATANLGEVQKAISQQQGHMKGKPKAPEELIHPIGPKASKGQNGRWPLIAFAIVLLALLWLLPPLDQAVHTLQSVRVHITAPTPAAQR
jgi:hypothetical protein